MEKEQMEAENAPGYSQELQAKMVGCSQYMSEWTQLQPRKQTDFLGYSQRIDKICGKIQIKKSDINRPKNTIKGALRLGTQLGLFQGTQALSSWGLLALGELGLEDWNLGDCWKH